MVEQEPQDLWPRIGNPPSVENEGRGAINAPAITKRYVTSHSFRRGRLGTVDLELIHVERSRRSGREQSIGTIPVVQSASW